MDLVESPRLLLVALFTWWAGSYGVAVNRLLISIVIAVIISCKPGIRNIATRMNSNEYLRENWKHLLSHRRCHPGFLPD